MDKILQSNDWCKPALKLLHYIRDLSGEFPVIMHIRHSERDRISHPEGSALTTNLGRKAAFEFGANLPSGWKYRIWYTSIERTRETSKDILSGLKSNNVESEIKGQIPISTIVDRTKFFEMQSNYQVVEDTDDSARTYFSHWIGGFYPPTIVRPSIEFAKKAAEYMLRNVSHDTFDILVSHDTWITALIFHWFGLLPSPEWINFLDGFAIELRNSNTVLITKEGPREIKFPYWLNTLRGQVD